MRDLKSQASTMGFTAVDGLMMGTRTGSLDPGVLLYLMEPKGMDAKALTSLLYKESGLLGVSGISQDMRTLLESSAPEAREAVDLFCYRIVREIGSLAAALGGLDALVFTGGIGEHGAPVRERQKFRPPTAGSRSASYPRTKSGLLPGTPPSSSAEQALSGFFKPVPLVNPLGGTPAPPKQ
jgi:acetate kinase